jgi:MoxR-like ATPase
MFRKLDLQTEYKGLENLPPIKAIELARVNKVENNPQFINVFAEPYLPSQKLVEAVNIAITLGRPLLLQGDPGCGKTRLAYAVAYELGLPIEECYIKSTSRAQDLLYTYDAVARLYDAQLGSQGPKDDQGNSLSRDIRNYIHLGPLGRAIVRSTLGRRSVVLIDEIDKADLDFPNDLLLELDRLTFQVAEFEEMRFSTPEDQPELRPIVIITHNEEKALPTAFLRRCIYFYLEIPQDVSLLQRILAIHGVIDEKFSGKAIFTLERLNKAGLSKKIGISELLDWVEYAQSKKTNLDELEKLPYLGALVKQQVDQERSIKTIKREI